jgi:hypothetical protein
MHERPGCRVVRERRPRTRECRLGRGAARAARARQPTTLTAAGGKPRQRRAAVAAQLLAAAGGGAAGKARGRQQEIEHACSLREDASQLSTAPSKMRDDGVP